jgi:hypothetical protein
MSNINSAKADDRQRGTTTLHADTKTVPRSTKQGTFTHRRCTIESAEIIEVQSETGPVIYFALLLHTPAAG